MDLTADQLIRGINATSIIANAWVIPLNSAMAEFGINTIERQAAFLAQVAHESMRLQLCHELWGPTPSQVRYERDLNSPWPLSPAQAQQPAFAANRLAYTLGNSEPGDGKKYAGRGPIQITGRTNMGLCGTALNYALITYPGTLDVPLAGARSAAWFFSTHGCNELADAGDLVGIRHKINGGTNGLQETLDFNQALLGVLNG